MEDDFLKRKDFWRVSGYSYPNPFSDNRNSREAWDVFVSFFEFESYSDLKKYWERGQDGRALSHQAVESWKATFEEFGLCYVLSGSDRINITPAGQQFYNAASDGDQAEFEWIGLSLLLRYPLRGGRRPKSPTHGISNLFPYQLFYAVLLKCDGYVYWTELERILSKTFQTSEAIIAVNSILSLRSTPQNYTVLKLPSTKSAGALYNSLNQFLMHAAMGYTLLIKTKETIYPNGERPIQISINPEKRDMIIEALRINLGSKELSIDQLTEAMPFSSEQTYFDVLGEGVTKRGSKSFSVLGPNTAPIAAPGHAFEPHTREVISGELIIKSATSFKPSLKPKKSIKKYGVKAKPSRLKPKRKSKNAKIIGDRGENIVLKHERQKLSKAKLNHLVDAIVHEAGNNNTPGWDITSFDENGEVIFIEVKATVGSKIGNFTLTANELAAARRPENRERYYIYLVFEAMSPKGARIETIKDPYGMIKKSELRISLESVTIGL